MSAELSLAQELVETLQRMSGVKAEMEKVVTEYQTLDIRRQEILTSLHDGIGEPRKARAKKSKTVPAVSRESEYENDELDQMSLGELSDLSDQLNVPNSGKMNAQELRVAIRQQRTEVGTPADPKEALKTYENFDAALQGKPLPDTAAPAAPETAQEARTDDSDIKDAPLTTEESEAVKSNIQTLKEQRDKPAPARTLTAAQEAAQKSAEELYDAGVEKRSDAQMRMIFALLGNHNIRTEAQQKDVIWGVIAEQHNGETLGSTSKLSKVWATGLIDFLNKAKPGSLNKYLKLPF